MDAGACSSGYSEMLISSKLEVCVPARQIAVDGLASLPRMGRVIPGREGETWDIRLPAHGTNSVAVGILLLKFCDDQMC